MKILRLRMTKSVILVIFSVHCGEKIWIIVNLIAARAAVGLDRLIKVLEVVFSAQVHVPGG